MCVFNWNYIVYDINKCTNQFVYNHDLNLEWIQISIYSK